MTFHAPFNQELKQLTLTHSDTFLKAMTVLPTFPSETIQLVWQLSRAKMTIITAVTHLCAAILSTSPHLNNSHIAPVSFSVQLYLRSWIFILVTQFTTHFFGELFDQASDKLNVHATPLTGGTRILVRKQLGVRFATRIAMFSCLLSIILALFVVPSPARPLAFVMLILALAYAIPPLILNHRALGELDASLITSVLVPHFSAVSQNAVPLFPLINPSLMLLVIPPALVKIALFLVLNEADRRPDWASGKITLPVILNQSRTAQLHAFLMASAYASALFIVFTQVFQTSSSQPHWHYLLVLPFLAVPATLAWRLSLAMLPSPPYRMDSLIPPTLFHSTLLVWSILAHTLFISLPYQGLIQPYTPFVSILAWFTFKNLLRAVPRSHASSKVQSDTFPNTDIESNLPSATGDGHEQAPDNDPNTGSNPDLKQLLTHQSQSTNSETVDHIHDIYDVVIVGGGVAGLIAAITLHKLGLRAVVLERRSSDEAVLGADLALWPGAIAILQKLGIQSSFFTSTCYPLHTVLMCNMDFSNDGSPPIAQILKTIDMRQVTEQTCHDFLLVSRQKLMDAINSLVPSDIVIPRATVVNVTEQEHPSSVYVTYELIENDIKTKHTVSARVCIGADGAHSRLRAHVAAACGASGDRGEPQFCNEVCYRGVLDASDVSNDLASVELKQRLTSMLPDGPDAATMRINYGAGLRSSFGYMNADGDVAYWWVKKVQSEVPQHKGKLQTCDWPYPLNVLHDLTPENAFYVHPIEDGSPLPRWSSNRVVLVGDSAHVVTPNMGQGACLATEDAFILAVLLRQFWDKPDGHVEAFYQYEFIRKPFAQAIASESRKQLFLGQLSSWIGVWARETLLRIVPTSVLIKTLRKNNFPIQSYLEDYEMFQSPEKETA